MKKYIFLQFMLILCMATSNSLSAQYINWMSWEEAIEKLKTEERKIFVDVYTEWCSWCKKMDRETFANPYIIKYLNENFYPVKLDAQQRNDIVFNGKIYRFIDRGRNSYHELAVALMNGKLSYPTIVFLDERAKVIQSIPGYRTPFEFELFITYFGENHHKKTPWVNFKREKKKLGTQNSSPQINVKNKHK